MAIEKKKNMVNIRKFDFLWKLLYFVVNEYVFGGHIAGTALLGMVLTFGFIAGEPLNLNLLLIAYFVPLIVYSYDHYKDIEKDKKTNPQRAKYLETKLNYYNYIIGTYIVILVSLIIFGGQSIVKMLAFVSIIVGGGLLYALSFKNFTKYIPAYKNIFVSLEWALAATFLVIIYNSEPITEFTIIVFVFIFLKYITNTVFCDLKDLKPDAKKGLKTVPVLIGYTKSILFLCLMSIITILPLIVGFIYQILPIYVLLFIIFVAYDLAYILLAYFDKNKKNWSKYVFMADIEITLWPIILIPLIMLYKFI